MTWAEPLIPSDTGIEGVADLLGGEARGAPTAGSGQLNPTRMGSAKVDRVVRAVSGFGCLGIDIAVGEVDLVDRPDVGHEFLAG